ncbi:MAG: hypothetical protein SGI72_04730 [Planctomycetota bacterium]|nr:hypothetical protein [Planctomycetota bacterium]
MSSAALAQTPAAPASPPAAPASPPAAPASPPAAAPAQADAPAKSETPSAAVLGKNDAAFAAALHRSGFTDLADRLLKTIERSGKASPEEAIGIKALHLDLRQQIALRESDPTKRKDLLRTILQEKEDLVTQYKGRPVAEDVRYTLPDVYGNLVDAITAAIAREKNPDLIAQLQKEGSDICTRAEDALKARIVELGMADASPEVDNQLLTARFNLPRMMYFHALLYPKSEFRREDLLKQAIKGFQEFGLDYSDVLQNYEALILEGLCHKEMGAAADAKAAFKDAYKFPENLGLEKDTKGYFLLSQEMADTVSEGALQLMNMHAGEKDAAGVLAIAKEFLDTTPGPYETRRGLAILAAKAEAHLALNDARSAGEAADLLVKEGGGGAWTNKGLELGERVPKGGPLDTKRTTATARAALDRGDDKKALQLMRQLIENLKVDPDASKNGPDAYLFVGSIYARRGFDHEAAFAFDEGADRFPGSEQAPELIYQAIQRYIQINKDDKRPSYKKRIDDRMKTLASKYAGSERAQGAVLLEGEQAAAEKRYLEAAELYSKVQPSSKSSYLDAQCRTAEMYFKHAIDVLGPDPTKAAEVKTYTGQAEPLFKKVITDVEAAIKKTLAFDELARLEKIGLRARTFLAQLYLRTDRAGEVLTMLEGSDERYANDGEAISRFWAFRIQALQKLGRLEEAIAKLDELARKDPKSKAVAAAAPLVAYSLDEQGLAAEKASKKNEATALYKRAAKYYAMGARALLAGDSVRVEDVDRVANRLFALGMTLNEVPETQNTFVGWDPKKTKDPELFQLASELYESSLKIKPSSKARANLGSLYGFLGNWDKAASAFADLFENQPLLAGSPKKINVTTANNNPHLLVALFEQAVAENHLAVEKNELERFPNAQASFDALIKVYTANGWNWWHAQYYAIKNRSDSGKYVAAKTDLNDLERKSDNLGVAHGLGPAFERLKEELKNK